MNSSPVENKMSAFADSISSPRRWTFCLPEPRILVLRAPLAIACAALLSGGCRPPAPSVTKPAPIVVTPSLSPFRKVKQSAALPTEASREKLRAATIADVRERLMSHRDIERDAERMVKEIGPIVEEAALQPEAQAGLAMLAQDAGIPEEEARRRWVAMQTADLMLESGGDPDAFSSAAAVGAAQWMAGTAVGVGLHVDLPASNRLTAQITALRCRIAWIKYLSRPDADRSAPGAPPFSTTDTALLPSLTADLERLRQDRRRVDERYDPRLAIFAQTRYLLHLYPRFPSPDWLFQSYHGGEAGVTKTLRLYLGPDWPGAPDAAIRTGDGGSPLTFDTLFFSTSPASHREAFAYLFSRSDDHRHYWYKLLAAEQTLDVYRKSPESFHKEWESSLPGRRIEAHWYPEAPTSSFSSLTALANANALVPIAAEPGLQIRPAPDDPANAAQYRKLRPLAKGALRVVVSEFKRYGGKGQLTTGDLAITQEYADRARLLHPSKPLPLPLFPPDPDADLTIGGGPPRRFDYHTTGLVFDVLRPKDDADRKILEYALDRLEARGLLSAIQAKDRDERRYHIVPHPAYADAFARMAR